jgi:hypothetical protein
MLAECGGLVRTGLPSFAMATKGGRVPRELIHVDNGRVTWSAAVAKVARALNPIGDAAEIVASIGACVVEIGQLRSTISSDGRETSENV